MPDTDPPTGTGDPRLALDPASHLTVNVGHPGPDAWLDRLPRLDVETGVRLA